MSTTTVAAPRSRRTFFGTVLRIIFALVLLILLAGTLAFFWFYHAARSSLAQMDGTVSLSGLQSPVSVIRDEHGVPHLTAANLQDLFFAQGYVTAQDRLWQMDLTRRAVAGEMAEIFPASSSPAPPVGRVTGKPRPRQTWVDYDKQQRIMRLRFVSERVVAQLPPRDRAFFEAYAKGVNAYIDEHRDNLPIEFRVLSYMPRPWTATDSLLIGIGMSQLLNPQFETEYWREKLAARLSPELMADLYPADSWRDHPPAREEGSSQNFPARVSQVREQLLVEDRPQPPALAGGERSKWAAKGPSSGQGFSPGEHDACEACLPGSNNWVVSGQHTVSGKPLLSNDMHLPHRVPGVWYEVQLHSGDFNAEGFSLPGMPFLSVGHNQRIAWGFTNLNPDVQDLFVETFNAAGEYQTPTGWQKPEIDHQIIHVKGKPDVTLDVEITRHGPIVSSLFPGETRKIALQWMIYDARNVTVPLFDLNAAQNWEQFRKALSQFATPSQNVVYADVDGNIGYQAMGFAPIRAAGDGTLPVSGADGKHDWTGYIPFDKMPSVYNPPSGIIATANAKITPDGYPYVLATQWFPPYRTERIYKLLKSGRKFSPADMLAIQTDITSEYDRFFAGKFVYAIDHSSKATSRTRQAADVMRGWDGRMLADSAAPTIEVRTRRYLWEMLLEPRLGNDADNYEWSETAVALENIIDKQPDRWLPPGYANFNDLLNAAVEKAIKDGPANLQSWRYGDVYPVVITHPIFGGFPILHGHMSIAGPGTKPQSGGGYTVKQVGRGFGPSERMTVDFSNLDGSTFNIVLGESGQPFSPHYMDQWEAWYNDKTFPLAYSDPAVQQARRHELKLEPANK
ncbi:MAG TPA: penicillin acylase family protein [Candidatus Angelobacter sp.]|nr:penicillin acylase family protein [Candidatus Angelobacter sp.]